MRKPKGDRRRGNRLWRVETPAGPVLQKYYRGKAGLLRDAQLGVLVAAVGLEEEAAVVGDDLGLHQDQSLDARVETLESQERSSWPYWRW